MVSQNDEKYVSTEWIVKLTQSNNGWLFLKDKQIILKLF